MSLLTNADWANARLDQRIIGKCTKVCSIGEIRETDPVPVKDQEGIVEAVFLVPLTLEEPAKSIDGEDLAPGFPTTYRIRLYQSSNGPLPKEPKNLAQAQELSLGRIKALAAAGLGYKRNTKEDLDKLLDAAGGWTALNGKKVVVSFDVRSSGGTNYQEVQGVSAMPQKA